MNFPDWTLSYPITGVYRYDLQRIGFTNAQIDSLSDLDMLRLTQKMQVLYLQSDFFKHLEIATGEVLQEKEEASREQ